MGGNTLVKNTLVLGIIALLLCVSVIPSSVSIDVKQKSVPITSGNTLYVGGSGPNNYTMIQDAIDDANPGDTVFVYNGTYYENIDITTNQINLKGEDKNTTIIDGSSSYGNCIRILNCDYVNISELTIRNAQIDNEFIYPEWTGHGVLIWAWVSGGGSETASYENISKYLIYNNSRDGVRIGASDPGQEASYNEIVNCEIFDNNNESSGHGVIILPDRDASVNWAYTRHNKINNCSLYNNNYGIYIGREGEASNNIISGCEIFENLQYGIYFYGHDGGGVVAITSNNYVYDNTIYGNHLFGMSIETRDGANCGDNYIFHNNFLNLTNNAYDEHTNFWNDSYPSGGNYWSDYSGNDTDGDCIGDTPYNISGGNNQDLYPFMYQNGWINNPPYPPRDPIPPDGATNVPIDTIICWTGGDPDPCDTVIYDVYFGTYIPPPCVLNNITFECYMPEQLEFYKEYYWQIVAWDNHGASTESPIWSFSTGPVPEPDLVCEGSLSWTNIVPGATVSDYFSIENIGEPESHLAWMIYNYPIWGNWSFNIECGENLTPEDGQIIINVSVVAPNVQNEEFNGSVLIVNQHNHSDYCTIDVTLATPKNKPFLFNFPLLSWLIERFPILQRLLSVLEIQLILTK